MNGPALGILASTVMFLLADPAWTAVPGTDQRPASGLVTGVIGQPQVESPASVRRALTPGDRIVAGDLVRTARGDRVEIVWDRRALLAVPELTELSIHEQQVGHTNLLLKEGQVHVALAYRAGRPTDVMTVQTPSSHVITRGGIVEIGVPLPGTHQSFIAKMTEAFVRITGSSPSVGANGSASPEIVTLLEGQARIEPLNAPDRSQLMDAPSQVRLVAGAVAGVIDLPPGANKVMTLAASTPQIATPAPITQLIVGRHVEHALEVERSLPKSAGAEQKPDVTNPDVRGAVLPTSLGVPTTPSPSGGSTATQSTAPVPTLPPPSVTTPTISSLAPSQSGGINSDKLLKEILRGDDRGERKGKRGGRDD